MSEDLLRRGAQRLTLRHAALRLGLQTAISVAVVVVALVLVALAVVLRSQHAAAINEITHSVRTADDVTDPPSGAWLVIRTPTKYLTSKGLPAGFPDAAALEAGVESTTNVEVRGTEYLVYTQPRAGGVVVQGGLDLTPGKAERNRLIGALLVSGAVGLVLAALAGAYLSSRAMQPLAAALALQRRFVADASHELRTPLTLLSTRAQLVQRGLRRQADPATLAADVDGLVTDAGNLAMVLEDLLVAADPRGSTSDVPVDLCVLAAQVAAAGRANARGSGVDLTCSVPGEPVVVTASPGAIRRAMTALVDNAVRHASHEVTVSLRVRGNQAVLEVSDDGPGIDVELLPRLFDRFESSSDGLEPVGDGERRRYGLGLALVSEVAARHHGDVSAHNRVPSASGSEPGGAILELALPYVP